MKLIAKIVFFLILSSTSSANTLYGVERIGAYRYSIKGPVYVQMGSFAKSSTALKYQQRLKEKTTVPILVKSTNGIHKVVAGPFYNQATLKNFEHLFSSHIQVPLKPTTDLNRINRDFNSKRIASVDKERAPSFLWFMSAQAGGEKIISSLSSTTVHNGSGYPAPYDQDIYSVNNPEMNALLGVQAGRKWLLSNAYLSALSLGASYQYFFAPSISGQVTQFSLPEFTNYNYRWTLATNLFLANAKLNGPNYQKFSPYLNGGIGVAYNKAHYTEMALDNVTARISPNYGVRGAQFAYILGAGIDYQLSPKPFILSLGYQYSSLGSFASGYGLGGWSTQRLNLGANHSSAFLFGLTYQFEANHSI